MRKFHTLVCKVLITCCTLIYANSTFATHIRGSDISYRCLGGNQYEIVVTVYRDCSGVAVPTSITVDISSNCGTSTVTCTQDAQNSGIDVSQLCPTALSTCVGGSFPGVQLYTYVGSFTLTPNCGTYTFSYDDCCRNTVSNLVDPAPPSLGFQVQATLNSDLVNCDDAPTFTSLPVPYFCLNQSVNYSHGAFDTDGDSLVYTLSIPLDQGAFPLTYQGTFSPTNPMPTAGGFAFDSTTGQMTFTPTAIGTYVVDVLVSEYRNGVLIGTTMRDIQIVIINCSNNAPVVNSCLTTSNVTGGAVVNSCNSLGVCPGTTISFTIGAKDPDGQPLTITSNIATSIPTATLTTTPVGPDSVTVVFTWSPSPLDTGFRYFTIQFEDNACPITGVQLFTYNFIVLDGTDAGPDRFYCTGGGPILVNVYGGTHFSWNNTNGMVSANADSGVVYLAPAQDETYIITSDLLGGCKNADTITVFNVPDFQFATSSPDDTVCLNESTQITVTATPLSQGPFTYSWTPVNAGIQTPNTATTIVKPVTNTMYYVTVISASGCTVRDSIPIYINGVGPKVSVTPSTNFVCPGSPVELTTNVSAVNCGPVPDPQNPCLPGSSFALQDVGTAGTSANVNCTPYIGYWMDGRVQYLYRASELQAAGLTAGAITDVAFNVITKGSTQPYNSFTIKMTCTSLNALPTNYVAGLSTVLAPQNYTTTLGWNTHTLDTAFNWDGFSNIIMQVCFDNNSYTGYDNVAYTTTSFLNSVLWDNADLATTSGCTNLNTPTLSANRPNTRFILCVAPLTQYTFTWTGDDGSTLPDTSKPTAIVNHDVVYSVVVADGTCQGDTSIALFVDTAVLISAGNDTTKCGSDSVALHAQLLHPAVLQCVPGYNVTSIPYAAITPTGATTAGPTGDDVVSAVQPISFNFNFFCNQVSNFYISTNGFITFSGSQGTGCCAGQSLPTVAAPNNLVAMCWEDLNVTGTGTIDYFVNGTAPNRVLVVRWNNVAYFGGGGFVTGELQLYESTNLIEVHVSSQNNPSQTNTLGVENGTGTLGFSPPGYNAAGWVVTTPVGFRFTPQTQGNILTMWQWTPSTGLLNDTATNTLAYPSTTTDYVLTGTFSNGCVTHDTVKVSIGNFTYTLSAVPDSICQGDTAQLQFVSNGVSFNWTPNTNLSSSTTASPFASPPATTTYYITAFDSLGCSVSDSVTLAVRTHAPVTLGNDTSVCPYDSVTLAPSGSPYTSFNWSTGANTSSISTGSQTASSQDYWVRVNDGYCFYNSDTITIGEFVLTPIVVQPSGDTGVCIGDTIQLSADPGFDTYIWSNGANTQIIFISTAGDFSYIAIDDNGCTLHSLDTAHVTIGLPPVADIQTTDDTICAEQTTATLFVNPVSGIVYSWEPGSVIADSLVVSAAGDYYLQASDNGCRNFDTIFIAETTPPTVDIGEDQNICGCDTLVSLTSNVAGTYQWSTQATTPIISISSTGSYSLTVTDFNQCTGTDAVQIDIHCLTVNAYVADPPTATVFIGHNATLDVDSFSYTGSFSYSWNPSIYLDDSTKKSPYVNAPQETTLYLVMVTDLVNGCVAYDSVRLAVLPPGIPPMPNAFSPNNDGVNDLYGPYIPPAMQGIYTIVEMRIYNRWGQLVYNGNGYWDGYFNGALQPADSYVYYIVIQGPDQNNPNINVHFNLTGSFTLLH